MSEFLLIVAGSTDDDKEIITDAVTNIVGKSKLVLDVIFCDDTHIFTDKRYDSVLVLKIKDKTKYDTLLRYYNVEQTNFNDMIKIDYDLSTPMGYLSLKKITLDKIEEIIQSYLLTSNHIIPLALGSTIPYVSKQDLGDIIELIDYDDSEQLQNTLTSKLQYHLDSMPDDELCSMIHFHGNISIGSWYFCCNYEPIMDKFECVDIDDPGSDIITFGSSAELCAQMQDPYNMEFYKNVNLSAVNYHPLVSGYIEVPSQGFSSKCLKDVEEYLKLRQVTNTPENIGYFCINNEIYEYDKNSSEEPHIVYRYVSNITVEKCNLEDSKE